MVTRFGRYTTLLIVSSLVVGCATYSKNPVPGPDKQAAGMVSGAAFGAGAGAVTGAEIAAATGPGALFGAGFGAVYGMFRGLGFDLLEEDQIRREAEERYLREVSWVNEVLAEHYNRRLELHPGRDVFPADLFFPFDRTHLTEEGEILARELALITLRRSPWSRIMITAYVKSTTEDSMFAQHLSQRRANALATAFVSSGVDPRRLLVRGAVLPEPILIDPDDVPGRYSQALEISALDN